MGEQRTGIPFADGLSCTLDASKKHSERYVTIMSDAAPLPLNNVPALALFRIMLSHIAQIAGDELNHDALLQMESLHPLPINVESFVDIVLHAVSDDQIQEIIRYAVESSVWI